MVVTAVTELFVRAWCESGIGIVIEAESSSSSSVVSPSRLRRGVPVLISVKTDWLRDVKVVVAAEWSAVIIEGPGKMWAFVR